MSIFDDNIQTITYIEQLQHEMKEIAVDSIAYCLERGWRDAEYIKQEFCSRMFSGLIIHKYEGVEAYQIYIKRVPFWWIKMFVSDKLYHIHLLIRLSTGEYIDIYNGTIGAI